MARGIPSVRLTRLIRTTAIRITFVYLAVFTASLLILGGVAYFGVPLYWAGLIRDTVTTELDGLIRQYEAAGLAGLKDSINKRATNRDDYGFVYLLQDPAGKWLAGQLPAAPIEEDWHDLVPPWGDEGEPFVARGRILTNGYVLTVGHDAHDLHELVQFFEEGLIWTFAFAIPLALLGGMFVSAITLRRVETINRATMEIRSGNLARRIPLVGTNDEFDRLAGNINSMLDGLEDLTDGLRQVSQDIAHDLRTPLTRVRQKLELAKSAAREPDRDVETLESSIADVDELLDAFNALLRIAQIESGTRKKGFRPFDLSEVFQRLVEDYEAVAQDSGRTITANLEQGVTIVGDRSLIVQMAVNLIENAICHTPVGTEILVALARRNNTVRASIADNGPGIPEESHEKLFRRFYRLDKSRHTPGSGLGLSLVAAVARLHKTEVALEDNHPGLKVVLEFPAH